MARILICVLLVSLMSLSAWSQEFRGSISGRVTEASGAAVPGATVTITNLATNTSTTATTNESGGYTAIYLNPGSYTVAVEASGFKKVIRQGIEVRVADRLELDLVLEVGALADTVNITSDPSLLETNTASAGQVIDRRRISELPLSDGNPFVLTRLAAGIAYTSSDLLFSRPFDNGGTSSISANGAKGGNEFTLDGSPNQASGRRVAFVPPADAVQEFKVETTSFDAQQSHTAGATVNVILRSGTNEFHGTAYEFVRNDILSANNFFSNSNGKKRDVTRYNRFGGTIGGPVRMPKKLFGPLGYDGRNRSFFFFAYEGLKDAFQEPGFQTVPTLAMRQGNFSALLPSIVIYDPATARMRADGKIERMPFQGNQIPEGRFNQVAKNYLQYYPLPNVQVSDPLGASNYFSTNPRSDNFNSESVRFDQTINDRQKFFVRYTHNFRREARGNWTGEINGIRPTGNYLFRINNGINFDHVVNFSPTTILNTRVAYSRFIEKNVRQHQGLFDPASLGFSSQTAAFFGDASYFPRFEIGGLSNLGDTVGDTTTFNIYSVQPTLTKIAGAHSVRLGYDFRAYRENGIPTTQAAGRYTFNNDFTRRLNDSASVTGGQQFASFLLGLPTSGVIDRTATRADQTLYHGIFVHDDWKVTRRMTLNLGLRYELEGATTERFNRNLRGFDPLIPSPVEAAAKAAYAANPIPEVPVSSFNVRGSLLFADDQNRGFRGADLNNVQPRAGIAFQLNDKTVLRGGWGIFTVPAIIFGVNQTGFSQSTNILPTTDVGLSFQADLINPFPFGVASPPGASLGAATFLGRNLDNLVPLKLNNPQSQRWQLSIQRELPGNWLFEASYVGTKGYSLTTDNIDNLFNSTPRQYLSTSLVRDEQTNSYLSQQVKNPFSGLLPGTGLNNATTSRGQLLRPFPEFSEIDSLRNDGDSIYHSGQLRVEKRFAKGYSLLAAYTWSKLIEEVSLLNLTDVDLERRISTDDAPHRIVASGIWEFPFGRNRKWGSGWNKYINGFLGGWQLSGIFQWQSGRPIDLDDRNVVYFGDPSQLRTSINSENADPSRRVFDTSGFYFHDAAVQTKGIDDPVKQRADNRIRLVSNLRYFPSRLPGLRGQDLHLWDLSLMKKLQISEGLNLELRGEFLNAFNHVQFNNPETNPTNANFGRVTTQGNLPRNVQIGLKLVF
jgi:carboxypeptidase family protein